MKLRILFLACVLPAVGRLQAADEQLLRLRVASEVYEHVTITSVTATDIYFSHSRGLGNAKLNALEPALQKHFHFDPAKAAAKQSAQTQANALYSKALRDAPPPKRSAATAQISPGSQPAQEVQPHAIHAKSFLGQPVPAVAYEKWMKEAPDTEGKLLLLGLWA